MSFDLKFCEKKEGWAHMLVLDWMAQRRCTWTWLNISSFLTVAAAYQRFECLQSQHSASWDEVFPQSSDLNSVNAALTPERKPKLFQFYGQKRKCVFTKLALCFSFPFSFISALLQSQAIVAHLLAADFPCTCWQGLHYLGSEWWRRMTHGASAHCFSLHWLPSSSLDFLHRQVMRGRSDGVPCPYMCSTLTHQKNWPETAVLRAKPPHLPPCLWPGSLPASFFRFFPAHPSSHSFIDFLHQ